MKKTIEIPTHLPPKGELLNVVDKKTHFGKCEKCDHPGTRMMYHSAQGALCKNCHIEVWEPILYESLNAINDEIQKLRKVEADTLYTYMQYKIGRA